MTTKKMAIIATKGTLDMAYPPFILASTAAALGYDVQVSLLLRLQLLRKDLSDVMISRWQTRRCRCHPMPVMVQMLPGMKACNHDDEAKAQETRRRVAGRIARPVSGADVKFVACQMTVDLFEFDKSEFIDQVEYGGAAMFLGFAGDTDICLFV